MCLKAAVPPCDSATAATSQQLSDGDLVWSVAATEQDSLRAVRPVADEAVSPDHWRDVRADYGIRDQLAIARAKPF